MVLLPNLFREMDPTEHRLDHYGAVKIPMFPASIATVRGHVSRQSSKQDLKRIKIW
jgi:hypothetical protein